jgi:hypothetical protein
MKARTLLIAFTCALLAGAASAQEGMTGTVEIGGRAVQTEGNLDRAAEYRTTDDGAELRVDLKALFGDFFLALTSEAFDTNDHKTTLDFELTRSVRSHTTYTGVPHRLEHDPLTNLRGTVKEVVATWSTDLDPNAQYGIDYSVLTNTTEFQFPNAGWLTVGVHYREQWREGHKQSMALSHCSSCHVQSKTRAVDEHTRDGGVSARATLGAWAINGAYVERDFRERGATPTRVYELIEQPALRTPLFRDRAQYDLRNGALAYDLVPTTEKKTVKGEIVNENLGGFAVSLTGAGTKVTNMSSGNEVEYEGFKLALGRRVGTKGTLSLRARTYSIDSTDYYVDTTEPIAVAGPYAGKTFRERYGYNPDFLRQSAIDRDVTEAQLRYAHKVAKGSTLAVTYDVRSIDRDSFEVAPGETGTLEQRVKLAYSLRPAKGLQLRATATFADIAHPFAVIDAACNPTAMQTVAVPSPVVPGSTQYYQVQEARIADLSASPEQYVEIKLAGSYQLGPAALASVSYQWWDGANNGGDLNDWAKTLNAVVASVVIAPSEKTEMYVGASYRERELRQHTCIPLQDG